MQMQLVCNIDVRDDICAFNRSGLNVSKIDDPDPIFKYCTHFFEYNKKKYYILGTVHCSPESQKHVEKVLHFLDDDIEIRFSTNLNLIQ
jgi:hypothetical protein